MYKVWKDKVTIDCWKSQWMNEYRNYHPCWEKIANSIDEDLPNIEFEKAVNIILKKYKAKMIRPRTCPHYIRFPNEKMAMWFLLEWS